MMHRFHAGWMTLVVVTAVGFPARRAWADRFEQAPVSYSDTAPSNAVTRLAAAVASGEFDTAGLSDRQFLDAMLAYFNLPRESQVLVFSKTSLQHARIHPQTPRAIYFNQDVYLGWVQGGDLEVAVQDPALGMVFYQVHPPRTGRPEFVRNPECLNCHATSRTLNLPGVLVRSVFPDELGHAIGSAGSFLVQHETPIPHRWGGWYVTGQHGDLPHMGNRTAREVAYGQAVFEEKPFANLKDCSGMFPVDPYPVATSDIVALMILEHQVHMHNLLNQAALETRLALHRERIMDDLFQESTERFSETTLRILEDQAEQVLGYLLFQKEAPLPEDGIEGDRAFVEAFRAGDPVDNQGRGLRDLQLLDRLFKYRCSYMIHSQAFAQLPDPVRDRVLEKLFEVLSAAQAPEGYTHLSDLERRRILDIVRQTVPRLPARFTALAE